MVTIRWDAKEQRPNSIDTKVPIFCKPCFSWSTHVETSQMVDMWTQPLSHKCRLVGCRNCNMQQKGVLDYGAVVEWYNVLKRSLS